MLEPFLPGGANKRDHQAQTVPVEQASKSRISRCLRHKKVSFLPDESIKSEAEQQDTY